MSLEDCFNTVNNTFYQWFASQQELWEQEKRDLTEKIADLERYADVSIIKSLSDENRLLKMENETLKRRLLGKTTLKEPEEPSVLRAAQPVPVQDIESVRSVRRKDPSLRSEDLSQRQQDNASVRSLLPQDDASVRSQRQVDDVSVRSELTQDNLSVRSVLLQDDLSLPERQQDDISARSEPPERQESENQADDEETLRSSRSIPVQDEASVRSSKKTKVRKATKKETAESIAFPTELAIREERVDQERPTREERVDPVEPLPTIAEPPKTFKGVKIKDVQYYTCENVIYNTEKEVVGRIENKRAIFNKL